MTNRWLAVVLLLGLLQSEALLVSLHRSKLLQLHEAELLATFGSNKLHIKTEKLDSGLWTLRSSQEDPPIDIASHLSGMEAVYDQLTELCRTPEALVKAVEDLGLDYRDKGSFEVTMECQYPFQRNRRGFSGPQHLSSSREINPRMLLLAIGQKIQGTPAIEGEAENILCVIECGRGFVLAKNHALAAKKDGFKSLDKKFKRRPFSFSAALSVDIAKSVLRTLLSMHGEERPLTLLDPCAGSGTIACVAMATCEKDELRQVLSADVNEEFVQLARENLDFVTGAKKRFQFVTQDATTPSSSAQDHQVAADIVVANLPWGDAVLETYFEDRHRIVQTLGSAMGTHHYRVNDGACAAFITNAASRIPGEVYTRAGWQPEQVVTVQNGKQNIVVTLARLRRD